MSRGLVESGCSCSIWTVHGRGRVSPNLAPPIRNGHHTADDQGQHDAADDRDPDLESEQLRRRSVRSVRGRKSCPSGLRALWPLPCRWAGDRPHLIRVTPRPVGSGRVSAAPLSSSPSAVGGRRVRCCGSGRRVVGVCASFDESSSLTSTTINTTTSTASTTATIAPTGERFVVATDTVGVVVCGTGATNSLPGVGGSCATDWSIGAVIVNPSRLTDGVQD